MLFAAVPAYGQSAPMSLLPEPGDETAPAAESAQPAPNDALPADTGAPAISASALEAPNIDRIGLIDTANGGFSSDMWRGSDLELLRRVLPQLPRRMGSLAQRRLARALLLSAAAPPPSSRPPSPAVIGVPSIDGPEPPAPPSQWLLETRLIGLAAIGNWDDALALMDLVPEDQMTEGLRKLRADGYLITDRMNAACGEAQAALNMSGDAYWQKLLVFCNHVNGQESAASLGLSLLREQNVEDPLFFWAMDRLNGNRPLSPPNLGRAEPLHLTMLARAGGPVPDALIQDGDPTTLAVAAEIEPSDDTTDKSSAAQRAERRRVAEEDRVVIAERAVGAGTLEVDRLRLLYRQLNVKDEAPPSLATITVASVRERVYLFQTALAQDVPAARAEVIARVIDLTRADRGRAGPSLATVGRVYAPLILEIPVTADLIWFSGAATRALIAAGELDAGHEWLAMARSMARTSIEAGLIADGLWPVDRLLNATGGRIPPQALSAWRETIPQDRRPQAQGILLNILAAAGEPIAAADWLPTLTTLPAPVSMRVTPAQIVNGLELAAAGERVGEAVVFALLALGEDGLATVEPAAAQEIIKGLTAVGRGADARALAVEALLLEGL